MSINGDSPSQPTNNGSHRNGNWKNSGHNSSMKSTRSNNQTNMQKDYAMRQKSRESRRGNDFKFIKTRYNLFCSHNPHQIKIHLSNEFTESSSTDSSSTLSEGSQAPSRQNRQYSPPKELLSHNENIRRNSPPKRAPLHSPPSVLVSAAPEAPPPPPPMMINKESPMDQLIAHKGNTLGLQPQHFH